MELVIIRHGDALSVYEANVQTDDLRPLSGKGIERIKQAGLNLKKDGFNPDIIISSPYLRAKQSAQIISEIFNLNNIYFLESLALSNGVGDTITDIIKLSKNKNSIIIGHMPLLSEIVFHLTDESFVFRPAAYIHIKLQDGNANILQTFTP